MNVLLVEDQQRLSQALAAILREEGHHVDAVYDGRDGLDYARLGHYDAVVLDIMLPKLNGLEVVRSLRSEGNDVPVIMLTARDALRDKVMGLDAGADDYLTKPFLPAELLARLRALTRRQGAVVIDLLTVGNTTLDLQTGTLRVGEGSSVHLTQREFEVCRMLMTNAGQTISKAQLLFGVWGTAHNADENSVEAYVSFLRKKLAHLGSSLKIVTVRGMGYRLETGDA
ncbi:MAG: response regulator transcription factor [Coriobacteriales bacterium]|jgi:DNA-binding response OmpR family regulator|nr:response regulator transcription factor [Coriobacteriales bacterium]